MKKQFIILCLCLSFLFSLPAFSLAGAKTYTCLPSTEEPLLDGKLTEPFWKNIPSATDFFLLKGGEQLEKKQTTFKISYLPAKALYFGVICHEPNVEKLKVKSKDRASWRDDGIEIFIFPKGSETYFQFIANSEGARFNSLNLKGSLPLWDWEVRTCKGNDFYSMEFKIPFKILRRIPMANEEWKFNISRNHYTSEKGYHSSWSQLEASFHEPGNFSTLIFKRRVSVGGEELKYIEEEIEKVIHEIEIVIKEEKRKSLKEDSLYYELPSYKKKLSCLFQDMEERLKNIITREIEEERKLNQLRLFKSSLREELKAKIGNLKVECLKNALSH